MTQVKKQIITIAGRPGSGKSTTAKALAKALGYEHFSSGDLFRTIAKEHGIDVHAANLKAEKSDFDIDQLVDQRLRDIGIEEDRVVIDSRIAWHWIPSSFKVYLDLNIETAAARILKDMSPARLAHEHIPNDPAVYAQSLQERLESENRRYKRKYGVDSSNLANYNLVVDTGSNAPELVIEKILQAYKEWQVA